MAFVVKVIASLGLPDGIHEHRLPRAMLWGGLTSNPIRFHLWSAVLAPRIRLLTLTILSCAISAHTFAQTPSFRFTEKAGPYAVGLKVLNQYDHSRTFRALTARAGKPAAENEARPLQTLIWYPALKSTAPTMTVGDYAGLEATETHFDTPDAASVKPWLAHSNTRLWAVRDASAVAARFPVVIYAPSFSSTPWENADLCEYLASHGYVVIASPSMGVSTREMSGDVDGIDAQARDISFLLGFAQALADTDTSHVAVVGFSWGGISNLFAAARDHRIDALIALDGSMLYYPALVKKAPDVQPGKMTIPLLFFARGDAPLQTTAANEAPDVLDAWTHGDLLIVHMLALVHREFSSMFQRDPYLWKHVGELQKAGYGPADGTTSYGMMARYSLAFLDAYLKLDANAMSHLKHAPIENNRPTRLVAKQFRAAQNTSH